MINSNINISSNIYVRSNSSLRKDRKYVEKITGSKRLKEIKNRYFGFDSIPFTDVQNKIVSGNQKCAYARDGQMSWGAVLIDGTLEWENRCEYTLCPGYQGCFPQEINRTNVQETELDDKDELKRFFDTIGIKISYDTVEFRRDRNKSKVEEDPKEYTKASEQNHKQVEKDSVKYEEITTPDPIISAPIDSHIILNSGPGTGKTYTIIERLIFILKNHLCSADEIYILCYTRSAKGVIENKLQKAVEDGVIEPSAMNICILTFDSYATYFLMAMKEQGVITENFENYGYNERIKLFNKHITPADFEEISYFIVDEIQDLVNERAEMVLKVIDGLKCGYLLAGDRCQAIYDYEADDDATIDSVEFYKRAEELFPNDMQRYEITVNRRQSDELSRESSDMRRVLLNDSVFEQNKYASKVADEHSEHIKVEDYIKSLCITPQQSTAILCRSNGESEYISSLLCEKRIRHVLNRGVNNTNPLPRWIADIFWDHCYNTISKKEFLQRVKYRCSFDHDPEEIWEHLCRLTNSLDMTVLDLDKLITSLSITKNIPSEFFDVQPMLTVSTIHKAKGSEFDRVILIDSEITPSNSSAEEARVRYVALTRPKTQFLTMTKKTRYFKRSLSGRIIETGLHYIYKTHNKFCKNITVGLSGDIENTAFVVGEYENILDRQEYLIHNISLYDKVNAIRDNATGKYKLYHDGHCIGDLSKQMTDEIFNGVQSTDYKYNLPDRLDNLYISGITTEILRKFDADVPSEYRKSRICYGIQVTGLARLVFEKK